MTKSLTTNHTQYTKPGLGASVKVFVKKREEVKIRRPEFI
jgi:hypothetical protein